MMYSLSMWGRGGEGLHYFKSTGGGSFEPLKGFIKQPGFYGLPDCF